MMPVVIREKFMKESSLKLGKTIKNACHLDKKFTAMMLKQSFHDWFQRFHERLLLVECRQPPSQLKMWTKCMIG